MLTVSVVAALTLGALELGLWYGRPINALTSENHPLRYLRQQLLYLTTCYLASAYLPVPWLHVWAWVLLVWAYYPLQVLLLRLRPTVTRALDPGLPELREDGPTRARHLATLLYVGLVLINLPGGWHL